MMKPRNWLMMLAVVAALDLALVYFAGDLIARSPATRTLCDMVLR